MSKGCHHKQRGRENTFFVVPFLYLYFASLLWTWLGWTRNDKAKKKKNDLSAWSCIFWTQKSQCPQKKNIQAFDFSTRPKTKNVVLIPQWAPLLQSCPACFSQSVTFLATTTSKAIFHIHTAMVVKPPTRLPETPTRERIQRQGLLSVTLSHTTG